MDLFAAVGLGATLVTGGALLVSYLAHRTRLSQMAAMMVAMSFGMVTGILGGMGAVVLGLELGPATVAATLAGVAVGLGVGALASAMAALDGLLAGLMGGLMGPMTAMMVNERGQALLLGVVGMSSGVGLALALVIVQGRPIRPLPFVALAAVLLAGAAGLVWRAAKG